MSYYSPSSGSPHYRRGGRPSFSTPQRDAPRPGDRDLLEGLHSTPLQTLAAINRYSNDKEVLITNLECIGSYSWVEKASPTIIVPGSPRKWRNRATPYQVQPDVGTVFKDQNGYRMPKAVLFPLFKAVDEMEGTKGVPKLDWKTVDFVTDRNNLRKLLRWIIGGDIKDFRIDTQLVGKTILLNRWEQRYREEMPGYTYGFNFEKESTVPATGCEMASGHHRILIYDMNGLKIVVRHEVDACIPVAVVSSPQPAPKPLVAERKKPIDDLDDLIGAFSSVKIRETPTSPKSLSVVDASPSLSIISAGALVPQSSIVELTTRSMKNAHNFDWKEAYGQLWLSQTPHHFLARHERGRFTDVQKRKLSSMEMKEIVASHETIKHEHIKLRRLLDAIKQIVVKHGEEGRLSFVCRGGQLQVYERISKDSCLPGDVKKRFT